MKVSSLLYDKEVEQNQDNHEFDRSSKSEVCQGSLEEINFVDFLGIKNFLLSSHNNDFDVDF
jgi:hypothetical protein